ncbi:MAG: hypothetical protein HY240_05455 [Actinobacteria bacterium]|nr:hypothetical protein [Actinomycetota bacterium]
MGWPAPLAAFFFAGSWPGLLYGSEVMPNLWVALAAVAASGWALPGLRGSRRARDVGLAGALVAVAATFRPPDAALLAAPVLVALLVARAPRRWLVAITAGVAIGWLPWVIEMSLRFGGPLAALRAASALSHVGSAGVLERVRQYLSLGDGPLLGPATGAAVSRSVVVWSVLAAALAVTGLATARGSRRRPVLLAAAVGGVLGGEYLLLVTETAPRFLLPAGALLAIPAAAGLVELIRLGGRPALAVAAGAIVAWAVWQAGTALRVERQAASGREVAREVGVAVRSAAAGRPCAVASTEAYPEIGFAAGCEAQDLLAPDSGAWLASRVARGWATFVVAKTPEPEIAGARPVPAPKGWYAFELSPAP